MWWCHFFFFAWISPDASHCILIRKQTLYCGFQEMFELKQCFSPQAAPQNLKNNHAQSPPMDILISCSTAVLKSHSGDFLPLLRHLIPSPALLSTLTPSLHSSQTSGFSLNVTIYGRYDLRHLPLLQLSVMESDRNNDCVAYRNTKKTSSAWNQLNNKW